MRYTNIYGDNVQAHDDAPSEILTDCVLDSLTCSISQSVFMNPVVVPTGFMYDKNNIIEWLSTKNTDPLTNVELDIGKLKLIPCLNIYLLLKCLEKKGDNYIFHQPYGHIYDLLKITNYLVHGSELIKASKCKYGYYYDKDRRQYVMFKPMEIADGMTSFDLRDYLYPHDLIEVKRQKRNKNNYSEWIDLYNGEEMDYHNSEQINKIDEYNWKYLKITDIIGKCAYTQRSLRNKSAINIDGMLVHNAFIGVSSNPKYFSMISGLIPYGEVIPVTLETLFDAVNLPNESDDLIIHNEYHYPDKRNSIELTDCKDVIDIHITKLPCIEIKGMYQLFNTTKDKYVDWYLELKSTDMLIYENYINILPSLDKNTIMICNNIANNYKLNATEFNNSRESLGLPTDNCMYAPDISYLIVGAQWYEKNIREGDFVKMLRCVGTHFDNMVFENNHLSHCVFIACTGKIIFNDCKFAGSSFCNSKACITFAGGNCDQRTFDTLPSRLKIQFTKKIEI